jgi:NTE family protein
VAASSAVPIVLSPVALRDFAQSHCQDVPTPAWIRDELTRRYAPFINLDNVKLARYANDLRHGPGSLSPVDYLYLLDGGLADNLAVHGLLESLVSPYAAPIVNELGAGPGQSGSIIKAINDGRIKKVVLLVINARADPANGIDQSATRPGILKMIGTVTSVPIDSTTASVDAQLELLVSALNAAGAGGAGDAEFKGFRIYDIQIDFDQLSTADPTQRALREAAKSIPTLWTISKANLDVIKKVAKTLLYGHPCFQRLLLDESINADFIDAGFAHTGCPQASDP